MFLELDVLTKIKKYDDIYFINDIGIVKLGNKYGLMDKTGKEITPLIYDSLSPHFNELFLVSINNKYGLIDKTGREIVPLIYDNILPFPNEIFIILINGKYGLMDKTGKELVSPKYNGIMEFNALRNSFLNDSYKNLYKDLYVVNLNGKYGLIDKNGKEILKPKFYRLKDLYRFYDLLNAFKNPRANKHKKNKYDAIFEYEGDVAKVAIFSNTGVKYGLIDKDGNELVAPKYDGILSFINGTAIVIDNKKYGLIDKSGKEIFPPVYDSISQPETTTDLYIIKLNGKLGIINENGDKILPLKYDRVHVINDDGNITFLVFINNELIFLDKDTNEIKRLKCRDFLFDNGLIEIFYDGKQGLINKKGEEVVPLGKYERISIDYGDLYVVNTNLKHMGWGLMNKDCGIIDKSGNEILRPDSEYKDIKIIDDMIIINMSYIISIVDLLKMYGEYKKNKNDSYPTQKDINVSYVDESEIISQSKKI